MENKTCFEDSTIFLGIRFDSKHVHMLNYVRIISVGKAVWCGTPIDNHP